MPAAPSAQPIAFNDPDLDLSDSKLVFSEFNPNNNYIREVSTAPVRNNLYTLLFPFENLGDQLDSEIMPLRVQWAMDQGGDQLDPDSESWKRFKQLYGLQFGESKAIGLFVPELSYTGVGYSTHEHYDLGRYLRIVYLYVKPGIEREFEEFVHRFIVPTAEKILTFRDEVTKAPALDKRNYYKFSAYWRKTSMSVYMSTIPEFEYFVRHELVTAAQHTNTPFLTYRTVTGDRHNYHIFFPFNDPQEAHSDRNNLMVNSLLRRHWLQKKGLTSQTSSSRFHKEYEKAIAEADRATSEFLSHLLHLEEVIFRTRPDMSAKLKGRYTSSSLEIVESRYNRGILPGVPLTNLQI